MGNNVRTVVECMRCSIDASRYGAPKGKIVRNPEAIAYGMVLDDCPSCKEGFIPDVVVEKIFQSFPKMAWEICEELRWSGDHFFINLKGIYIGIEKDGTIHS